MCATVPTIVGAGSMLCSHLRRNLAGFLVVPDGSPGGLGASVARGGANRKEIEIRLHFERHSRASMWAAGIALGILAACGAVATARLIPANYASVPDEVAPFMDEAVSGAPEAVGVIYPKAQMAATRPPLGRRSGASCPQCGVAESMRRIEAPGSPSGQDAGDAVLAERVFSGASGAAIAAHALAGRRFEFTVRFRDGSTEVFNEASPRSWQSGSRVIVIAGTNLSNP